jgi:hypothetical protein
MLENDKTKGDATDNEPKLGDSLVRLIGIFMHKYL